MAQSELTKEDHVEVPVVEALLVEGLALLQIDYLTEVKNGFHNVKVELAENRMVVVQAQMAHVDLDLLFCCFSFAEFLSDLEESFFDLSLHPWLQLLLHIVKLKILSFEVLERVAFLFGITRFHVLHDWLLTIRGGDLLVMCHIVKHAVVVDCSWDRGWRHLRLTS